MATLIEAKRKHGRKLWYILSGVGDRNWTREFPEVQTRNDMYTILRKEFGLPNATDNTDIVFLLFNKTWIGDRWVDDFQLQLKALREKKGLTQTELAGKAGLSVQAISALEQGSRGPTWETVLKLAHAMGINIEDFRVDAKSLKWSDESEVDRGEIP
jgi:DNA-binding XRE family transcriptional regulator